MWRYILKRILLFIPTLIGIILLSFILTLNAPGDRVKDCLGEVSDNWLIDENAAIKRQNYIRKRKELNLDLPIFYFSITPSSVPDTLNRIPVQEERLAQEELAKRLGNWPYISDYYQYIDEVAHELQEKPKNDTLFEIWLSAREVLTRLKKSGNPKDIRQSLEYVIGNLQQGLKPEDPAPFPRALAAYEELERKFANAEANSKPSEGWIPRIRFHGFANQFHRWMINMVRLDFGTSCKTGRSIRSDILAHLPWTLVMSFISIFFAYGISIPLGIKAARKRGSRFDKITELTVFILFSLPRFWVALVLISFLGNDEFLGWFPSNGVQTTGSDSWPFFDRLADWAWHLVLPTIAYTYASFAFISRQVRGATIEALSQDYTRTARAKGLSEKVVAWKHAFRNSLIPIVTIFAGLLPSLIGGSIILERIFAIPGLGKRVFDYIRTDDFYSVIAFFTLSSILVLAGILLSDILYAVVDPRISFSGRNKK